MIFTTKTDIAANLNAVFAQFADFEMFERYGLRSGAEITRTDDLATPGKGMIWNVRMPYRGKTRRINVELVDYDPPNSLDFCADADGFDAVIKVELVPLSGRQTRATVALDITAKTLAAKLVLQSARLTKSALNKRFRQRLNRFGKSIEERVRTA
ncbi:MAG: SRPBCC family protein [Rhodobacteraceae bacterium]|nr:SRPBCC family protein [Paracoccaceae bacterium]